jgi:hypothetical protein
LDHTRHVCEGALTGYADSVYASLPSDVQGQAQRILLNLVQPNYDALDSRRLATRDEMGEGAWPLVQQLADARLVVTNRSGEGKETAELAHEALIREWRRLRHWLQTDR